MIKEEHENKAIISLPYFGNINHFKNFKKYNPLIEAHENYQKKSLRNKTRILGVNGSLLLSVPLIKGKHQHNSYQDVKIAYHQEWQRIHLESIKSAYGNSAYFDHYFHPLAEILNQKPSYLWDLNLEIRKKVLQFLKIDQEIKFSNNYQKSECYNPDLRNEKDNMDVGSFKKYNQVFEDKGPFVPNLSILDLLFNMGPEANHFL